LRKRLRDSLLGFFSSEDLNRIPNSFDIVGDIAVIKLPSSLHLKAKKVANTIMRIHRNVKTVLLQVTPVTGDLRLRSLAYVNGENKTSTIHREFGCLFSVDLANCYFSPRLSHERMKIARMVEPNETVVNMFAGVGCFSIVIARHANPAKVFSIDINPAAIQFMKENIKLNRVYRKVIPLPGDSKEIICNRLCNSADRVLMLLPEKSFEYLPFALSALKKSGGWIHYYSFEYAPKTKNPGERVKTKITGKLDALGINFTIPSFRIVRSTGPNYSQIAADIHVTF
jgi:tRNA (guanine37-N1)-methyltransferase